LQQGIADLFAGKEVNNTENRPALHMALRSAEPSYRIDGGEDVKPLILAEEQKFAKFVNNVRSGKWKGHTGKPIKTIVNIGIGGSDLGPKMVCQALKPNSNQQLRMRFISSIDANHVFPILTVCDPETTLFIVESKTFGTEETLTNANTCRGWLLSSMSNDASAVAKHFVAVTTNIEKARAFGIDPRNMFGFWDWVGGRYSVWSAIGLPIALSLGMEQFKEFQAGAAAMDSHFKTAPIKKNLPALLGLLGVWNQNFLEYKTHAILPYDEYLRWFPDYLQQLEMESNGKSVNKGGQPIDYKTCPILWGGQGNNGQHAFYQLLHQGTRYVFHEFFAPVEATNPMGDHHLKLLANCLAQSEALMKGRTAEEAREAMKAEGLSDSEIERLVPFRSFAGDKPSHTFLYKELTPRLLGSLIALYEHKTFTQGWIWDINSFDQWGVELGKQMCKRLQPILSGDVSADNLDASTKGLINYTLENRD
jgi:glucose-6-phosphate isomerase